MVLKQLWCSRQMSRADIARHFGLSRSTVSAIMKDLMETGLINTLGAGASNGGRRPIILGFNDDAYGIIGVELGASHISVVITNLRGSVVNWRHQDVNIRTDPVGTLNTTIALIHESLEESQYNNKQIVGIGIGVPSPVHEDNPGKLSPQILPAWAGVDLVEALEKALDVPVFMENDANLGALAERWWGAGIEGGDLAYIKVATGIGSGHIINGAIYRGSKGFAGEIGHTTIEPSETRFNYGMRGSLTSLVGTQALLERANALRARHPETALAPSPNIQDLVEACLQGDPLSVSIVEEAGVYIGFAVANMLNLLNPSVVVLGGALTSVGECLLHPLRQTVRERTLWGSIGQCNIVTTSLDSQAIAVGAATLVLEAALRTPNIFPTTSPAQLMEASL